MGANEDRLRTIAAAEPFDLPGLAALRTSLSSLQETLKTVGAPEAWKGTAAEAASERMNALRSAYARIDVLLARLENKVDEANVYRNKAIASVDALPDSKAPGWVHMALNAAEPFSFPGIGPVDVAQGGLSVIENFLGNKRESAAAAALEDYASDLTAPTAEMAEVRQELSGRPGWDSPTDPSQPSSSDGGAPGGSNSGAPGGYPRGPGSGSSTGGSLHWVAPEPPRFVDPGPPSFPVPDDNGPGYIPGGNGGTGPIYGGGSGSGTIGSGGSGSGGIGAGGVLGGIGAAGAMGAVKVATGGLGGLGGTVGKLGTGGMLGAGGLAGRPGAAGGTGLIGNASGGAGGAGGAGAAGSRSGAAGAGGRSGMSAMHGGAGGAGGKEEKRRARVGMAGPMAPKLDDDDNLGPRAAGTRAGGRDTDASAELPDADAE